MPWGAAIAGVATVAGSVLSSNAAGDAADQSAQTQREQMEATERRYQQTRSDLMPYMEAGTNALAPQQALLGLSGPEAGAAAMANFTASPGYQYQFDQGQKAVQTSAANAGLARSGATLKALQDRGNSLAMQDFGTYYNRLAGLAQTGQNSAAGVGAQGMQAAGMNAQAAAGIAQTQASAGSTQASIYGNAASGVGSAINQGYQNYQYGQQKNALAPDGGGYPAPGYAESATSGIYKSALPVGAV